ncbi:UNVERIFIED_ORG: NADP-dependent alcohol dehydrogenase [Kosakonia oryzae]|uniref:NADP-dependent alcohol dehydrogenase n=1 Tax=Kosakonia radicincitans TaxID=283686 RepID=A0AAX2EP04_9ENTR|nr:iron-containing alcohol dehydrogenase [Kosakonia radicincitans]MDP9567022.1 NADP-dependent alcohol dehydrogenase [Kosakonia oryzae]SFE74873.1 NADP-dependent alcohol dehydrogenase [Kosakonia radicincitans]SFR03731.1 NADP-dependent alcohol dehydrogenase [Kosakonia radicincitans]SFT57685.1 NADP-dependent alcohol dehydrogenase [Kosakonia radicincitans]SFX32308.1 NADP-dependent alcohol dehydrogenase [Kosakonia radicincitans]
MQNFIFHNPAKIIFGHDQISSIGNEIPGDKTVMIVYGGGSVNRNGTLKKVRDSLKNHTVYEFGGVQANPHYETLMEAVALVKDKGVNFLLAVGGGSVIDGTKFVAAAACYDGDAWDIVKSYGSVVKRALPVGCVLTIAATGSEMNNVAVVTKAETKDKLFFASPYVMPQFSVLEPELTFTLPPNQTANGVVDAFVHVLEQYVTYPVNAKVQDRLAEGLLNTLKEEGPKVLTDTEDYDARANIMWAATMALNGLLSTGTPADWASHLIGQEITGLYGLDHARTLAVMIPAIWKYALADKKQKLAQYGERVWDIPASDTETMALQAIDATVAFFETMGVKTRLSDYGLGDDIIPAVTNKLKEHGHVALGEHANITTEKVEEILKLAL